MSDPLVTVVVPMHNEEAAIKGCLEAILASRLPEAQIEVLVVDGMSSDRSREIVQDIANLDRRIRLLDNPRQLQAAAFNIGLAQARGIYFARVDARTTIPPDYLSRCIEVLRRTGAANVGGPIESEGSGAVAEAIAVAYGSAFGLGHGRHDPTREESEVDSVSFGTWQTGVLRELGGMDSSLAINEDYELNFRLRRAGHRIIWNPEIRAKYQVRGSLSKLARQYFRYGFWKVRTLLAHPDSLRWRQLVAPAFALSVLLTPLAVWLLGPVLGTFHLVAYLLANLAASIVVASKTGWAHLVRLPLVFLLIHLSWGFGFLAGWCWWPFAERDEA